MDEEAWESDRDRGIDRMIFLLESVRMVNSYFLI